MNTLLRVATAWVILSRLTAPGDAAAQIFQPGRPPGMPQPTRPPMTAAPPETERPEQQQPTFRTTVELVELTVVATRKDGQFAGDLTAADFQIFDEGTPQTISAFAKVEIPLPPELARAGACATRAAAAPASGAAIALPPEDVATSSLHPDARLFVLVLDDLHVAPERTQRVRTSARRFVERHTSPADLVAIVTPSGRKDMLLGFTRDRARLLAVIDQFHGQKLRSATYERDVDKRFGGGSALRDGRDPNDGERAYRARVTMATLADVSTMLAATQGRRKSLLYFSEGIDYNVADVMGSVQRYASEVTHTIEHALSTAIRTNVSLYAIDPRGLTTTESDAVEMPIHAERTVTDLAEPGRGGELGQSIRALRDLAEPTGGFAATDTNDLDAAFGRIVRENSTYYVIGFQPSKRGTGGTFRKIDVRVTKPGVTISTRRGYLVPRRAAPAPASASASAPENTAAATKGLSPELAPLLASALPASGLPIRVQAIPFKGATPKTRNTANTANTANTSTTSIHLVVEIDGRDLTFESKDAHFTEELTVAMVTIDSNGRAANGAQTGLALKLTPEELARVKTTGLRWQAALDLTPGHYQLRVAGRAVGSNRRGLVIAEIDVPDFTAPEVGMSGIALTSLPSVLAITSGRKSPFVSLTGPPTATREFVVGDRITAAAQVYSAVAHQDGLRVTARVEAAPDADRMKPLEATRRVAAAAGSREEVPFTFGTDAMPPGQYILTIRTHRPDGTTLAERRVLYAVVRK